jgi:cytochrome c556
MTRFTDEQMQAAMTQTREYTVVLLEAGPQYGTEEAKPVIWEHGRRNFELRAEGILNIVCPITDDSPLCGVGIFPGTADDVRRIMDEDPGVRAGVFTYRVHPTRSFPGDSLQG